MPYTLRIDCLQTIRYVPGSSWSTPSTLSEKMNYELLNVFEYTKTNKRTINRQKSFDFIIPPKTTNPIPDITCSSIITCYL